MKIKTWLTQFFAIPLLLSTTSLSAEADSTHPATQLLSQIPLKGTEHILDIGSGDGKMTAIIAKKVEKGHVIGIDKSEPMIQFSQKAFPRKLNPNLEFVRGEAEKIAFEEKFDVITSFSVLHWTHNHQTVIGRIHDALKPQGYFALSMPLGFPEKLQIAVDSVIKDKAWRDYFVNFETGLNFVSMPVYKEHLEKGGFEIKDLVVQEHEDHFPNRRAFIAFLAQWFPYLRALPMELKGTFLTEVIDHYLQLQPLDDAGRVKYNYYHIDVLAVRK